MAAAGAEWRGRAADADTVPNVPLQHRQSSPMAVGSCTSSMRPRCGLPKSIITASMIIRPRLDNGSADFVLRPVRHVGQPGCGVAGLERAGHAVGCLTDATARFDDAAVDDVSVSADRSSRSDFWPTARSCVCATTTVGSMCGSVIGRWLPRRSNTAARVGVWASDHSLCRPTRRGLRSPAMKLGSGGCASPTSRRARCKKWLEVCTANSRGKRDGCAPCAPAGERPLRSSSTTTPRGSAPCWPSGR